MWERSGSASPGNRGMDPPAKTNSTDFTSRPRTDGRVRKASTARRRRTGGDVHGAIPVRGPCDRMCGSASVRGSSTRVEMHQFCQPPPKYGLGTARKKSWKKSLPRGPRFTPEGAMALVGPSPCWWREAVGPLPKRGVRWNASGTARSRAVATGLSQQSWWLREGNVNSSTALRASSQDGHSARDEEFSARRDMDDVEKDADTASVRPPTPAPVFRRRPKPKRGRGRPRLPKPPPRHPRPDPSKTSPQASRQQNALFKGLARQMTGLSALGLPNSPELQRWRATVEEDHQARRPGRKPKGSAAAKRKQKPKPKTETERADASDAARRSRRRRKCGVCGGEGHNARTCALAPPRRDSEDLVSYYEAKYGNLGIEIGTGIPGSSASLVSVARDEKNAKRKKKTRSAGREPRSPSRCVARRVAPSGTTGGSTRRSATSTRVGPGPRPRARARGAGAKATTRAGAPRAGAPPPATASPTGTPTAARTGPRTGSGRARAAGFSSFPRCIRTKRTEVMV